MGGGHPLILTSPAEGWSDPGVDLVRVGARGGRRSRARFWGSRERRIGPAIGFHDYHGQTVTTAG